MIVIGFPPLLMLKSPKYPIPVYLHGASINILAVGSEMPDRKDRNFDVIENSGRS